MQNRRTFIRYSGITAGMLLSGLFPFRSPGKKQLVRLCILYTNDTQSQIDPFPDHAPKFAGLGGIQARADLLQKIRSEETNVLLFDAGDFFHGGPYFDLYKGALEIKAMNLMQYDAACIGEHDFDGGIDNLAGQIAKADFPIVCANYDLTQTSLAGKVLPYTIIEKEGIRIGVLGVGMHLKGWVPEALSSRIPVTDPVLKANETALFLKKNKKCNFIICLSHLGLTESRTNPVNDRLLAQQSACIDLIIGGHSHTLLQKPLRFLNQKKKEVLIVQAGWGGVHIGRADYVFCAQKNILSVNAQTVELPK